MTDYPERDGAPDCRDFIRTGRCKYGDSCKYNHPPGGISILSDPTEPLFPLRPEEPPCSYYLKHGFCKFGQTCKFHHPSIHSEHYYEGREPVFKNIDSLNESGVNLNESHAFMTSSTSLQILPQRPSEINCTYYMRFGTCKFGTYCRYHHPLREDYVDDGLVWSHEIVRRNNNRNDDRGRSFSMGSLLETRHSNVYSQDGHERRVIRKAPAQILYPNTCMLSRDQRQSRVISTNSDQIYLEAIFQDGLIPRHDSMSSAQNSAHTPSSESTESPELIPFSIRNEIRGRSLSNNDIYSQNECRYLDSSFHVFQRPNQRTSKLGYSSNHQPSPSKDTIVLGNAMDLHGLSTINNIPPLPFHPQHSETQFQSEIRVKEDMLDRHEDQTDRNHHLRDNAPSMFTLFQPKQNIHAQTFVDGNSINEISRLGSLVLNGSMNKMVSTINNESLPSDPERNYHSEMNREYLNSDAMNSFEVLYQNKIQHVHQRINNGSRSTLTCAKQLEKSLNLTLMANFSKSDETIVSLENHIQRHLIAPTATKENTIFCDNGKIENLWKYP